MKNLIVGLGGCGNNILNLLQNKKNKLSKTLSIQRDLQILSISNSDFKLNIKDVDFEIKLNVLLEYSNNISLIVGLSGTNSVLVLDKLIKKFQVANKEFKIFLTMPSKDEGLSKQVKANNILEILKENTNNYEIFSNNISLSTTDNKIIESIGF